MMKENTYMYQGEAVHYYETGNGLQPLVFIHAQGIDGKTYAKVAKKLARKFHVYSVDCFGHGGSSHNPSLYNVESIGKAVADFIENVIGQKIWLCGHSSGGLIAAYIAAGTDLCERLILEDPPFFSSYGERRKSTFNYVDLSTVCHNYNTSGDGGDFVLYYFRNQYAWNFFPAESREKVRNALVKMAENNRRKHPDGDLKVLFWPKAALAGFKGMSNYDPLFGETFYNDSFHCGIPHEEILSRIRCRTVFMKAKDSVGQDGILMAALNEDDAGRVVSLIPDCGIVRFNCGHGIHVEKPKEFIDCILNL